MTIPQEIIYDRGGKGKKKIQTTLISTSDNKPLKRDAEYQKRTKRRKFRIRAAIEPVIGHFKSDFRMQQNFLHGEDSPQMSAFLSATAWNMKRMVNKLKKFASFFRFSILIFSFKIT